MFRGDIYYNARANMDILLLTKVCSLHKGSLLDLYIPWVLPDVYDRSTMTWSRRRVSLPGQAGFFPVKICF